MLDLKYLESHTEEAIARLVSRRHAHANDAIGRVLAVNAERKRTQQAFDTLAAAHNQKSKAIGEALSKQDATEAARLKQDVETLKNKQKDVARQLKTYERSLKELLLALPNLPDPKVPHGTSEQDHQCIHRWGDINAYPHATTPHWDLLVQYSLASFPLGTQIAGAGFPVYKGRGAKLQRALIAFFLDQAMEHGYEEILPPLLVNAQTAQGTGQLPDKEGLMYALQDPPLYLIPTAEVPVTNLYAQTILHASQLPIKHVAYSPCFRKEAGSWGAHVRGLNRLHQFDKVELVEIHHPEQSAQALTKMRTYVQSLLEKLDLPYRTLLLCTGDLGQSAAMTYDVEVWSAAQKKWLEVSSISSCHDYQARRMNLRYREDHQKKWCHTLNGSALALPRLLAALVENNQTATNLRIPPVLHPYTQCTHIPRP